MLRVLRVYHRAGQRDPLRLGDYRRRIGRHRQQGPRSSRQGRGLLRRQNFPTATFRSTGLREDNDRYALDGEFSLRGVTKPITLTLEFFGVSPGMGKGEVAGFEAKVALSRKGFGVLTETPIIGGGALLGDTVDITIEVEGLNTT